MRQVQAVLDMYDQAGISTKKGMKTRYGLV